MRLSELRPICGIYAITNLSNGIVYIGQSVHIYRRLCEHTKPHTTGHSSKALYADYDSYGLECFSVTILCECDPDELGTHEERFILEYKNKGIELYNLIINNFRVKGRQAKHYIKKQDRD